MKTILLVLVLVLLVLLIICNTNSNYEKEYKKIIVVPYGRKRYVELLIPQLMKYVPYVSEIHLWINTTVKEDLDYAKSLESDVIKLKHLPEGVEATGGGSSIYHFFKDYTDDDTVYIRFDDDVVLVDDLEAFKKFVDFRINHPEYFLVYPTILNNAVITYLLQQNGIVPKELGDVKMECTDEVGWKSGEFSEKLHRYFLDQKNGDLKSIYMPEYVATDFTRISINCIAWLGSQFKKFEGRVGEDEEQWLSVDKPKELNMTNCVYGNFACVHYAFYTQRELLDKTDVLKKYSLFS